MDEINFILLTDYLFFLIFILFLALVIGFSVKAVVWLLTKGAIKIWPFA
jgi:hypothetical protein